MTVAEVNQRQGFPVPDGVHPTRARHAVRQMLLRQPLQPHMLNAPLMVLPDDAHGTLPGAVPTDKIAETVQGWGRLGIRGVKIFASGPLRDARASGALKPANRMHTAIKQVKDAVPDMVVTSEVCGCSWTDHGECVLLDDNGKVNLSATYELLGLMAVGHANAGADIVSPTAMLDGSVRKVRDALDKAGHQAVGVCPTIAIDTVLYGPFKKMMNTNPGRGHRRGFQLEAGRADRDALTQAQTWIGEGADSLTLQPVMTAVDVLVQLRGAFRQPIIAYSTSGEYAALQQLGTRGTVEYHAALHRAGADLILSFGAEQVARSLNA